MNKLWIIAVCVVAGCGEEFVEADEDEEPEVIFLEYGVWQPPPPEDVCVDLPPKHRPAPDAGRHR